MSVMLALACSPSAATEPATPPEARATASPQTVALPAPPSTIASTPAPSPPAWRDDDGALLEPDHWLPSPARRGEATREPAARLALDDGCRRCHAQAAREHEGSQHPGAWASPAFQRAFTVEPRAFCQRCHAPEENAATAVGEVSPAAASLGVGCVTCHVQPGTDTIWAAPRPADTEAESDAQAPHPILRGPAFAGPQACAGCHEFPFPDEALREHPLAMQSTVTEHAGSAAADRSCADCHMPKHADGQRSHVFAGAYDQAMLARALEIEATREGPTVRLSLRPGQVGHAVPTGDLLRRLMVEVTVDGPDGPDGAPEFRARRYLGRSFGPLHQGNGITVRGQLGDDRVGIGPGDGAQVPTFTLPAALADRPVRWRIVHQRVAQASREPRAAPIEGELEFASGVL
jgi:Cytochrome c554 and c-prime